jgi:hypothetical protein
VDVDHSSVHSILLKAGYRLNNSRWSFDEIESLKRAYTPGVPVDSIRPELAISLKRTETSIELKASKLGLGDRHRPMSESGKHHSHVAIKEYYKTHPGSNLGKKLGPISDERRKAISENSRKHWAIWKATGTGPESESSKILRATRMRMLPQTKRKGHSSASAGERPDYPGIFFRSSWEANIARYLDYLKSYRAVDSWSYESRTFLFEGATEKPFSYTPDFEVSMNGATSCWEVKGWKDKKWNRKIKIFRQQYPGEPLRIIGPKEYSEIENKFAPFLPGWEHKVEVSLYSRVSFCEVCGSTIRGWKRSCSVKCRGVLASRAFAKRIPSKEDLYNALLTKTCAQVGEELGVHSQTIGGWAKKLGVRVKSIGREMRPKVPRVRVHECKDWSGSQFGSWTVLHLSPLGRPRWTIQCQCGIIKDVVLGDLKSGKSRSCRSCSAKAWWSTRLEERDKRP